MRRRQFQQMRSLHPSVFGQGRPDNVRSLNLPTQGAPPRCEISEKLPFCGRFKDKAFLQEGTFELLKVRVFGASATIIQTEKSCL